MLLKELNPFNLNLWKNQWGLTDEDAETLKIVEIIINQVLKRYRNFAINYEDQREFYVAFEAVLDKHTPTLLNRARYIKMNFNFLKDTSNWSFVSKQKSTASSKNTSSNGYAGYNSADDEPFQKDWQDAQNTAETTHESNPMVLAREVRDLFAEDIIKFEYDIENLLRIIY